MKKAISVMRNVGNLDTRYAHNAGRTNSVLLQGKWRIEILCAMRYGPVRVGQLSRLIPRASKKMLAQNLRHLEADGIIVRRDLSDVILHVEYDFNDELREGVCALIDHLAQWGRLYAVSRATSAGSNEAQST